MSDESHPTQLCHRYNITPIVLYHWKKQYSRGKFNNEPTEEGTLKDRTEKLKRPAGKLTWRMSLPATGNKQLLMFQLHIPMAGHEAKPLQ